MEAQVNGSTNGHCNTNGRPGGEPKGNPEGKGRRVSMHDWARRQRTPQEDDDGAQAVKAPTPAPEPRPDDEEAKPAVTPELPVNVGDWVRYGDDSVGQVIRICTDDDGETTILVEMHEEADVYRLCLDEVTRADPPAPPAQEDAAEPDDEDEVSGRPNRGDEAEDEDKPERKAEGDAKARLQKREPFIRDAKHLWWALGRDLATFLAWLLDFERGLDKNPRLGRVRRRFDPAGEGWFYAKAKTITGETGDSERVQRRLFAELKKRGLIAVRPEQGKERLIRLNHAAIEKACDAAQAAREGKKSGGNRAARKVDEKALRAAARLHDIIYQHGLAKVGPWDEARHREWACHLAGIPDLAEVLRFYEAHVERHGSGVRPKITSAAQLARPKVLAWLRNLMKACEGRDDDDDYGRRHLEEYRESQREMEEANEARGGHHDDQDNDPEDE